MCVFLPVGRFLAGFIRALKKCISLKVCRVHFSKSELSTQRARHWIRPRGFPGALRSKQSEGKKHETGHFRTVGEIYNRAGNSDVPMVADPPDRQLWGRDSTQSSFHAVKTGGIEVNV